ncbi:EpsG family protein [Ectobacillus antri]|uniref:EpsG family protein n=1 Tax=Ectobacillus antri TaxID=2486280 RepID=UPI000F590A5C|nr:EpsG family protein [Ectobacillus antri]
MTMLWLNLIVVFVFASLARYFSAPALVGHNVVKPNILLSLFALSSLVLVSGLRNNIGDTFFYMHTYEHTEFTWEHIIANKDMGFGLLQMLLQQISKDSQILLFTTALITNVLIVMTLYKYSRMLELSLYVYITSGLFTVSMNGIRQFLAAAIIFAATKYLLSGNWKKYILVILFASTIHQSALVLIPIYFIVRTKAWTKMTFLLLSVALLIVIGFNQFSDLFFSLIGDTQYGEYGNFNEGGANIVRVMVDAVPLFIAFLGRERLRELFSKSDYIVNMALIGFMFMIVATQNWIFARFTIYFGLYQLILVSWVVKLFASNNQRLVYYSILLFYFLYHFFEQVIALRMVYKSDFFSL